MIKEQPSVRSALDKRSSPTYQQQLQPSVRSALEQRSGPASQQQLQTSVRSALEQNQKQQPASGLQLQIQADEQEKSSFLSRQTSFIIIIGLSIIAFVILSLWLFLWRGGVSVPPPNTSTQCIPLETSKSDLDKNVADDNSLFKSYISADLKTIVSFAGYLIPIKESYEIDRIGSTVENYKSTTPAVQLEISSVDYQVGERILIISMYCKNSPSKEVTVNMTFLFVDHPTTSKVYDVVVSLANVPTWGVVAEKHRQTGQATCTFAQASLADFDFSNDKHYRCTKVQEYPCIVENTKNTNNEVAIVPTTVALFSFNAFAFELNGEPELIKKGQYSKSEQKCQLPQRKRNLIIDDEEYSKEQLDSIIIGI